MKTLRERADDIATSTVQPYTSSVAINAERVLRELVEGVSAFVADSRPALPGRRDRETVVEFMDRCREETVAFLALEIRRRFLGPPSAEEVAGEAIRSRAVEWPPKSPKWIADEIVAALRAAGLLREGAR